MSQTRAKPQLNTSRLEAVIQGAVAWFLLVGAERSEAQQTSIITSTRAG